MKLTCVILDLKNKKVVMKTLLKYNADFNVAKYNDKTALMTVNFNIINIKQLIMHDIDFDSMTIHR